MIMFVQASLHTLFHSMMASEMLCLRLSFIGLEQKVDDSYFVSFKNAVLALQILCMMGMWMFRRKLAYAWTDVCASSAFLCSFVLLSD